MSLSSQLMCMSREASRRILQLEKLSYKVGKILPGIPYMLNPHIRPNSLNTHERKSLQIIVVIDAFTYCSNDTSHVILFPWKSFSLWVTARFGSPGLCSDQRTFRFLFAKVNGSLAELWSFGNGQMVTCRQYLPMLPLSPILGVIDTCRALLHMKKTLGAAIFVHYSKCSDLSFASIRQTFAANNHSVEQTFNQTITLLCSLVWMQPCSTRNGLKLKVLLKWQDTYYYIENMAVMLLHEHGS